MKDAIAKLDMVQARINAWRAFFDANNSRFLHRAQARVIWFNEHEPFTTCCIEFESSPQAAAQAIGLMLSRANTVREIEFTHKNLGDVRASLELPLSAFGAQGKALAPCAVWFGVPMPLTVRGSDFEMKCVLDSHGRRWGRLYWRNPARPDAVAYAGELRLPRAATREEMRRQLLANLRLRRHITAVEME